MAMSVGQFCWNQLATPNAKEAKEFYSKVFGWNFIDLDMDGSTYSVIKKGNEEFAGIWQIPKDQQKDIPPNWMSYILVDSIDTTLSNVKKHGASVKVPATQAGEFGKFAVIVDPTGAHIAVWEAADKKG